MSVKITDPENYHVALYIRLSKEDDNEGPSQSVLNQKDLLEAFAKRHKLAVYDVYIDDGRSGTRFDRPAFNRMIDDIEDGNVNMVITKDLSRLGRNYSMIGYYTESYFPEHRVRYISVTDGTDTGVETSANDVLPFRAIMDEMYAKDISKKIKSVKNNKQRKGEFIGGKPVYGYKMHPTEKNKIVIDEDAAPIVRRIFAMALDGVSCRKIASVLNEENVPTPATYANLTLGRTGPYTGLWSGERISDMLQNETYIGNMVQGRSKRVNYKSKKSIRQPREDWIVVEDTHEPLVDKENFQKVRMLVESRKRTRSRTYDFLLKGLIFCRECGYPMAVLNRKNAAGEDVLYFVCRTYQRFTKAGVCSSHTIKEATVTEAVLDKVREVCQAYLRPEQLQPMALEAIEKQQRESRNVAEIKSLKVKIDTLTNNLDKVYMDRLNEIIAEEDFQRIYRKMKAQQKELIAKHDALSKQAANPTRAEDEARELVARFVESACTNRELLISLIDRIELTEDKQIIIKFRFRELEKVE
ncbi:MAG: recombinase family protein [Oscillospiraceae bacterium]|nr:recombinase family protein [Oscillospiraceae bacterium]